MFESQCRNGRNGADVHRNVSIPAKVSTMSEPVKVALDVTVPTRFGPHQIVLDDPTGHAVTVADVCIEMVNGEPWFTMANLGVDSTPPVPLPPAALVGVDWHKAAWDAVRIEAGVQVWTTEAMTPDEQAERMRAVDEAGEESRRYNRLNRQQLDEVAELWQRGGAQAVAAHFCVSRRQADRYVQKARQAGAL